MEQEKKILKRSDIKTEDTWKMEDMFASDEVWQEAYKAVEESLSGLDAYKGRLGVAAALLCDALKLKSDVECRAERVYVYANQKLHEDTRRGKYQDFSAKAKNLMVKLDSAVSYMVPEILAIPEDTLKAYIKAPDMEEFHQELSNILRQKKHTLSAEMEAMLSKVGEFSDTAEDIFSMFNNADVKFGEVVDTDGERVELTHGRYALFMESEDRRLRKDTFETFYIPYQSHENMLAAAYQANAKKDAFFADVRGYESARQASLDNSNIPIAVYDNLIEAIHKALPVFHRYVALRKKLLKVDELHMYDVYAPLVSQADKKIPFEKAREMVLEGLRPMGEEYIEKLREGFKNRWIDVYENQGKRTGAYSWGAYGVHPYVLLNYNDSLNHVFTLAHEMGHALHSYYSDASQPFVNAGYRLFVAEVASTCNEALLIRDLLDKTQDKKERAYLINYFLEQFKGTMFRQTMFAEFEKITHEMVEKGETLNADTLKACYRKLNEEYFGPDMVVDEQVEMEWARIPHFYSSFYVYQYATGFAAAIALSSRILKLGSEAVSDYMKFLTGGCSKYPIDLLKDAGVDMTTPEPVEAAMKVFEDLIGQLEELVSQ